MRGLARLTAAFLFWFGFQVAEALPFLEQRDFLAARPLLEAACEAREPEGCYLLARTLLQLDDYEGALQRLAPLRASDPQPWRVVEAMALANEALGRRAEAEVLYRESIRRCGACSPIPYWHFGRFLTRDGRAKEAIAVMAPVAERFHHPELWFELGRAHYGEGKLAEAERALRRAGGHENAQRLLTRIRRQRDADSGPRP